MDCIRSSERLFLKFGRSGLHLYVVSLCRGSLIYKLSLWLNVFSFMTPPICLPPAPLVTALDQATYIKVHVHQAGYTEAFLM